MTVWDITLTVQSDDYEHMEVLTRLAAQYLRAAMDHTRRHDATLVGARLARKEEALAAQDSSAR